MSNEPNADTSLQDNEPDQPSTLTDASQIPDLATDEPHRWEIEPHYISDFDVLVTNNDGEAKEALLEIAENVWDAIEPGEERVIKVRMGKRTTRPANHPARPPLLQFTTAQVQRVAELIVDELVGTADALSPTAKGLSIGTGYSVNYLLERIAALITKELGTPAMGVEEALALAELRKMGFMRARIERLECCNTAGAPSTSVEITLWRRQASGKVVQGATLTEAMQKVREWKGEQDNGSE